MQKAMQISSKEILRIMVNHQLQHQTVYKGAYNAVSVKFLIKSDNGVFEHPLSTLDLLSCNFYLLAESRIMLAGILDNVTLWNNF